MRQWSVILEREPRDLSYTALKHELRKSPRRWLVTGAAGFIGSNLTKHLLDLDQQVTGLDNFATGNWQNLDEVLERLEEDRRSRFHLIEGDIRDLSTCIRACKDTDYVLHHAALGSVPHSMEDPLTTHEVNGTGTLNMLVAARDRRVKRFVYASSSSVYGDSEELPKCEDRIGIPLSPYAATKLMNEQYASVFGKAYGLETIGLRYFNVFGPRQDPEGQYAAVIPKWIVAMMSGDKVYINGSGEISRDFCYVANVVQANLLAAVIKCREAVGQVYNIALAVSTTLDELYELLRLRLLPYYPNLDGCKAAYRDFRPGDVFHSLADTGKARDLLGYAPSHTISQGLDESLQWYLSHLGA